MTTFATPAQDHDFGDHAAPVNTASEPPTLNNQVNDQVNGDTVEHGMENEAKQDHGGGDESLLLEPPSKEDPLTKKGLDTITVESPGNPESTTSVIQDDSKVADAIVEPLDEVSGEPVSELRSTLEVTGDKNINSSPGESGLDPDVSMRESSAPAVGPDDTSIEVVMAIDPPIDAPDETTAVANMIEDTKSLDMRPSAESMQDIQPTPKLVREREEEEDESGPDVKRAKLEQSADLAEGPQIHQSIESTDSPIVEAPNQTSNGEIPAGASLPKVEYGAWTDQAQKHLLEGIKNIRKGKHAAAFQKPVDVVQLNIPQYFDLIKHPMDLGTMEQKLKNKEYATVDEYVADFDQMVLNSFTFNGKDHPISQSASNIRAQLTSQLKRIPKPGEQTPKPQTAKKQRKSSASLPPREKRRESAQRTSIGKAQSPVASTSQTFALDPNGMPLIRRESNTIDGRPKREIHKPPPRDLPYAGQVPRKKKFAMQLKFCEWVLNELKLPRYDAYTAPFLVPVDPVALNIPDYLKVIKKPMDLQTMTEKLNRAQYNNAKDFENDFKLMCGNARKFNPAGHQIHEGSKSLEYYFDELFKKKDDWIAENQPASGPQSPEAASESEEEEEEVEEPSHDTTQQLQAIQEQIATLTQQAMALVGSAQKGAAQSSSKKGAKGTKPTTKAKGKATGSGPAAKDSKKTKAKPKAKQRPVTTAEKQEISNNIGELPPDQIAKAAELIKASLRKMGRHDLADRPDDDLEFDIDTIPDDALHELLKLVRRHKTPAPKENSFTASGKASASKKGKHKPMSKTEQEAHINRLKGQLESFQNPGSGSSQSPEAATRAEDESSDDDESGSESEEE